MLNSASKTLKISNKRNIGYKAMYIHVYEDTNTPLWLILSLKVIEFEIKSDLKALTNLTAFYHWERHTALKNTNDYELDNW